MRDGLVVSGFIGGVLGAGVGRAAGGLSVLRGEFGRFD